MGKVLLDMAMSLDGYISGPGGEDGGLYDWYFAPPEADPTGHNAEVVAELIDTIGAIIMGKRAYGVPEADWDSGNPYRVAHFVVTHHPPEKPPQGATDLTFVTDGIESALRQAQAAAGEKAVAVGGGADIAQQYFRAGLIDEITIHLVPVLLGDGIRLFDNLSAEPITLEKTRVIEAAGVTHLTYRVVK